MIQCPYCGADSDETARHCSGCMSLLVAEHGERAQALPRWAHPYAALAVIALISTGLLAFSLLSGPRPDRDKGNTPLADDGGVGLTDAGEAPAPVPEPAVPPTDPEKKWPPGPDLSNDTSLADFENYENETNALLAESDNLAGQLDRLLAENNPDNMNAIGDLIRQLQFQSQKIRKVKPPRVVQQLHNKLSNAQNILYRGYQKLMHYQKFGDIAKLDEGRRDLETSREKRQAVLTEIAAIKKNLAPPAAVPEPVAPPPPAELTPPPPPEPGPEPTREPWPPRADEGRDIAGPCIPRRLVEMYPPGPTRDKIAQSFAPQYNSSRLCGDPLVPRADDLEPPAGPGGENETEGPDHGATADEVEGGTVYEDGPTEEIYLDGQ